jgi:hypothetical protein
LYFTLDQVNVIGFFIKYDADYEKLRNMKNNQGKLARDLVNKPIYRKSFESKLIFYYIKRSLV